MPKPTPPQPPPARLTVYPFSMHRFSDGKPYFRVWTHEDDQHKCGTYLGHIELDRDTAEHMAVELVQYLARTPVVTR